MLELRRAYSLSFGLLRSDAAYEKFLHEWSALLRSGKNLQQIKTSKVSAAERVKSNTFTRTTDLLAFHLSALYAVVDKWGKWKFTDPQVHSLLRNTGYLKLLKKYRNTICHVELYNAKGTLDILGQPKILCWTKKLSEALRRAIRIRMPQD